MSCGMLCDEHVAKLQYPLIPLRQNGRPIDVKLARWWQLGDQTRFRTHLGGCWGSGCRWSCVVRKNYNARIMRVMLTIELDGLLGRRAVSLETWCFLLPQSLAPYDAVEERMCFDMLHGQSCEWIQHQQSLDQISCKWRETLRKGVFQPHDFLESHVLVGRLERRSPGDKLVDDASKRPQVAGFAGVLVCQQFWRDILGCSHKRLRTVGFSSLGWVAGC